MGNIIGTDMHNDTGLAKVWTKGANGAGQKPTLQNRDTLRTRTMNRKVYLRDIRVEVRVSGQGLCSGLFTALGMFIGARTHKPLTPNYVL